MTRWAYTPSSSDTVSTNLTIYCAQTVQPYFLSYLHSAPIPPHFMQQWAYTPIYLYRVHHQSRLLYTNCPASFPPLLAQWFHTSSFFDTVGLYPPFSYTVGKQRIWAHCVSKRGNEAGQCVYSRWRGWCPLCKKMRV